MPKAAVHLGNVGISAPVTNVPPTAGGKGGEEEGSVVFLRPKKEKGSGKKKTVGSLLGKILSPNGPVQQRGRLGKLHPAERRAAGPVCCDGWFPEGGY
jgi:hypothetical protein